MQSHLPFVNLLITKYPLGLIAVEWKCIPINVSWTVLILQLKTVRFNNQVGEDLPTFKYQNQIFSSEIRIIQY